MASILVTADDKESISLPPLPENESEDDDRQSRSTTELTNRDSRSMSPATRDPALVFFTSSASPDSDADSDLSPDSLSPGERSTDYGSSPGTLTSPSSNTGTDSTRQRRRPGRRTNAAARRATSRDELSEPEDDHQPRTSYFSDLRSWAPRQLPFGKSDIVHLPSLSTLEGNPTTSFPISAVQQDLEHSVKRLISLQVFEDLMKDTLGRFRFRDFLISSKSLSVASFDLYTDLSAFLGLAKKVRATAGALDDVFRLALRTTPTTLTPEDKEDVVAGLANAQHVGESLEAARSNLQQSLYMTEFQAFIKFKLCELASVKLGKWNLTEEERQGLGSSFCLTNPRLPDHPIVLVSPGFEATTGYSAKAIQGRNCRFLQGPATSPASVKRIRDALNRGEGVNTLLLNYRANGAPFHNLLCIIPLRNVDGQLTYFIGGQTNVSGTLAAGGNLSFLVGSTEGDPSRINNPTLANESQFSPSMQAYSAALALDLSSGPSDGFDTRMPTLPAAKKLAAGETRSSDYRERYQPASPPRGLRAFFEEKIFGRKSIGTSKGKGTLREPEQRILGAEAMLSSQAQPIELQMAEFSAVYSKVLIFRRRGREILFVTREFLAFLGLPVDSPSDVWSSPLVHSDILDLITAPEGTSTRTFRKAVKDAISIGSSLSIPASIVRKKTQMGETMKKGVLHFTPLTDKDRQCEAFVVVFG